MFSITNMIHLHHCIVQILPESNYFKHDKSKDTFLTYSLKANGHYLNFILNDFNLL